MFKNDEPHNIRFRALLVFPVPPWLLCFIFVVERAIKKKFQFCQPALYDELHRERKDAQYFAFIMGFLMTAASTAICYKALRDSTEENDILGKPHLSTSGQLCLASKGVMWASELNRLDRSTKYITHHLLSLEFHQHPTKRHSYHECIQSQAPCFR
jgi:hypothetical protein